MVQHMTGVRELCLFERAHHAQALAELVALRASRYSASSADADRGSKLFTQHCAACHGADLKGSDKGPPMLHKVYEPSHHADIAFQLAVANGVRAHHWQFGDMAPVPGLTPDDVAHITAFVRGEQRKVGIR